MTAPTQPSTGGRSSGSLYDVIELILDRGLVIDVFVRVSLVGIEVLTIDARVVVASVDTYLRFAEACGRADLTGGRPPASEPSWPGPNGRRAGIAADRRRIRTSSSWPSSRRGRRSIDMSTYVYGFTRRSHPLPLDGLGGVGDRRPPLRLRPPRRPRRGRQRRAREHLRAKRRDLEAHEAVLETLCAAGTVLPMRFGLVAADDDAVMRGARARRTAVPRAAHAARGKVELNVKAAHQEEALLRDLLLRQPGPARPQRGAASPRAVAATQEQVAFGERVAAAVDAAARRGRRACSSPAAAARASS